MKIFNILPGEETSDFSADSLWFIMPDSTIVRSGNPFFVPDFDDKFEALPMLAVKISRLGKGVASRFAPRYYNEMTVAVTMRASNLLSSLRNAGMPWDKAVIFDKSCFLGDFLKTEDFLTAENITFKFGKDEVTYTLSDLIQRINDTIMHVSRDNIIKMGDIILLPFCHKGFPLHPGSGVDVVVNNASVLDIRIK